MEETDTQKRVIRLGFLKPMEYEMRGNTIYVTLRRHGSEVGATAISKQPFSYLRRQADLRKEIYRVTNETGSGREGLPICNPRYANFLEELRKENDVVVEDHCMEDGITLVGKLEQITDISELRLRV